MNEEKAKPDQFNYQTIDDRYTNDTDNWKLWVVAKLGEEVNPLEGCEFTIEDPKDVLTVNRVLSNAGFICHAQGPKGWMEGTGVQVRLLTPDEYEV